MVIPVGGMDPPMGGGGGPPPTEALRLTPVLKIAVAAVAVAVIGEIIASYFSEAISDMLTILLAITAFKDASQMEQCIVCIMAFAGFNCISDIVTLVFILPGQRYVPGAKYFFSTVCYAEVRVVDPVTHSTHMENREICSWRTVVGNVSIVLAIVAEFACSSISYRIFKAYREEAMNGLLNDLAGAEAQAQALGGGPSVMPSAPTSGGPPGAPGAAQGAAGRGAGFVPFSGQGQRLE